MKQFLSAIFAFITLVFFNSCRNNASVNEQDKIAVNQQVVKETIDTTPCAHVFSAETYGEMTNLRLSRFFFVYGPKKDSIRVFIERERSTFGGGMDISFFPDTPFCIDQFSSVVFILQDTTKFKMENTYEKSCKGEFQVSFSAHSKDLSAKELKDDFKKIRTVKIRSLQCQTADGAYTIEFTNIEAINFLHYFNCLAEAK